MDFDKVSTCHRRKRESYSSRIRPPTHLQSAVALTVNDYQNENHSVAGEHASNFQLRQDVVQDKKRYGKSLKRCKKCKKHVTFATEIEYVNGYTPYKSGLTDAEVIELYHDDIWYNVSLIPMIDMVDALLPC
jgi:hypothetical protein